MVLRDLLHGTTCHISLFVQVFACQPKVEDILPYVRAFHALVRRRPFLVQRLEEVLTKLLTSLEFFDDEGRQKIAIGMILVSKPRYVTTPSCTAVLFGSPVCGTAIAHN